MFESSSDFCGFVLDLLNLLYHIDVDLIFSFALNKILDINDIIEVVGFYHRTPEIVFLRKGRGMTNLTGEKVSVNQVITACENASQKTGAIADHFKARPFHSVPVQLFNPFHDKLGRFTSKEKAAGVAGVAMITSGLVSVGAFATAALAERDRKKKRKRKDSTAVSIDFQGKKWSMTYRQLEERGVQVGKMGLKAGLASWMVGSLLNVSIAHDNFKATNNYYRRRYQQSRWTYNSNKFTLFNGKINFI